MLKYDKIRTTAKVSSCSLQFLLMAQFTASQKAENGSFSFYMANVRTNMNKIANIRT